MPRNSICITKYRQYVDGLHFSVISDHVALKYLFPIKDPHGRLARWALYLQGFDFDVIFQPGLVNKLADPLSRVNEPAPVTIEEIEELVYNPPRPPPLTPDSEFDPVCWEPFFAIQLEPLPLENRIAILSKEEWRETQMNDEALRELFDDPGTLFCNFCRSRTRSRIEVDLEHLRIDRDRSRSRSAIL